jgi:hypothetical protein
MFPVVLFQIQVLIELQYTALYSDMFSFDVHLLNIDEINQINCKQQKTMKDI